MKTRLIAVFLYATSMASGHSVAAQVIDPDEATQYTDSTVTVEGQVSQVSMSGGGTIFINFGGSYPDEVFFAVIFDDYADQFPDVFSLEGETVSVTGTVQMYKGKPEIIVTSPSQIDAD